MANGTLQPVSGKMIVSSPAGGIVRELFARDGEMVSKGEVLMVVESEGTKASLQATQKQLAFFAMKISCSIFCLIKVDSLI